eukprot:s2089_g5.t1
MQTEWTQPNEDEDDASFLARCRKESPAFGLVVGKRNIGLWQKRDKDTPISRVWLLQGVPKYWTHDQVQAAVGKTLTNVSLLKQRMVRGNIDYFLRGSTTSSDDMIAVPVEDSTGNLVLWLRWVPPRKNTAFFRQCAWRNGLNLAPPKQVFRTEPVILDISAGPPQVPHRGGGKSVSGACASSSEINSPQSPQSSRTVWTPLKESKAATEGDCASPHTVFTAVTVCGQADLAMPASSSCAKAPGSKRSAQTVWTPANSKQTVWTTAEDNGLDLGSGEKPQTRRRLVGKQRVSTANISNSAVFVSSERGEDDVLCDDGHPEPAPRERYWARGSSFDTGNGKFSWSCPFCPYRVEGPSGDHISKMRYKHLKTAHEGQGLPGNLSRPSNVVVKVVGKDPYWVCPLRPAGITKEMRQKISPGVYYDARLRHCREAHKKVSRARWKQLCQGKTIRASEKQKRRVANLNTAAARQCAAATAAMVRFSWPVVVKRRKQKALCIHQAWKCTKCTRCFPAFAKIQTHTLSSWICNRQKTYSTTPAGFAQHRQLCDTFSHGMTTQVLDNVFRGAQVHLCGSEP